MRFDCCKGETLSWDIATHPGFVCSNGHLQCKKCDGELDGLCLHCQGRTVPASRMNMNESLAEARIIQYEERCPCEPKEDLADYRSGEATTNANKVETETTEKCDDVKPTAQVELEEQVEGIIAEDKANTMPEAPIATGHLPNCAVLHWHCLPFCDKCIFGRGDHGKWECTRHPKPELCAKGVSTYSDPCLSEHSKCLPEPLTSSELDGSVAGDGAKYLHGAIPKKHKKSETPKRNPIPKENSQFIGMPQYQPRSRCLSAVLRAKNDSERVCPVSSEILRKVSNVCRATYNPPSRRTKGVWVNPPPQFEMVSCHPRIFNEDLLAKLPFVDMAPVSRRELTNLSNPMQCPEVGCNDFSFYSDFAMHISAEHVYIPMERIVAKEVKNFFIEPHLAPFGHSRINLVYLLRDKVIGLGRGKFKDLLPLTLMTRLIKFKDVCPEADDQTEFLMVWATGYTSRQLPIIVTLTAFAYSGRRLLRHTMQTNPLYDMRASTNAVDIFKSGKILRLSQNDVDLLTNGGKDLIQMQIMIQ